MKKFPKWVFIIAGIFLLILCALIGSFITAEPKSSGDVPIDQNILRTQIAKTLLAGMTQTVQANATSTPEVTKIPLPTGTPIFWDSSREYPQLVSGLYQQVLDNKKNMTDIQFKEYLSSIKGQRIHLKATVKEVNANNQVYFEATEGGFFDTVYLSGLPRDVLLTLNKGQIVEFDATIRDFTEFIITIMNLDDPVVYSIH